jgi:hypothetical protein
MKSKIRTSLEKKAESDYNDADRFHVAQKAWLNDGDIVLLSDQIAKMNNMHQIMLEGIANHIYGKRK